MKLLTSSLVSSQTSDDFSSPDEQCYYAYRVRVCTRAAQRVPQVRSPTGLSRGVEAPGRMPVSSHAGALHSQTDGMLRVDILGPGAQQLLEPLGCLLRRLVEARIGS